MPQFWEYDEELTFDGTEVVLVLVGGQTKRMTTQEIIDGAVMTGPEGPQGEQGEPGPMGPAGPPGVPWDYTTAATDGDPGPGNFRLNHVTMSLVTFAYFDDIAANGIDLSMWVQTFDLTGTTSNRGYLTLSNADRSDFLIYRVTGTIVDGGSYQKVPLTYIAGSATFTAAEEVYVTFSPAGDQGAEGTGPQAVTQAEYDALDPPDPNTWYVIIG